MVWLQKQSLSTLFQCMTSHIPQSSFRGDIGEPPIIPEVQDAIRSLSARSSKATSPHCCQQQAKSLLVFLLPLLEEVLL